MLVQIFLADYSKYSFVVSGDGTKDHKEAFKNMGGKWNPNLSLNGTPIKGWIFSFKKKDQVQAYLTGSKEDQKLPFGKVVEEIIFDKCDKSTQTELEDVVDPVHLKGKNQVVSKENNSKISFVILALRKEIQELNNKLNELNLRQKHQEDQLNMYISLFQMHKLDIVHDVIGELNRKSNKL